MTTTTKKKAKPIRKVAIFTVRPNILFSPQQVESLKKDAALMGLTVAALVRLRCFAGKA